MVASSDMPAAGATPEAAPMKAASLAPAPAAIPAGKEEAAVNPRDFKGDVLTDDAPPSAEVLLKAETAVVLDAEGREHSFKSLYEGEGVGKDERVLVVFVRHFFCGNCQEYIRTLTRSFPVSMLTSASPPISLRIIGCGAPDLIPLYISETGTPWPVFADPSRSLYAALGMQKTLAMGPKQPKYMRKSLVRAALDSVLQGLRVIRMGKWIGKGGDQRQVGGEFLFGLPENVQGSEKVVTWCHRMRNTRDHAEVEVLVPVLGLDADAVAAAEAEADRKEAEATAAVTGGEGSGPGVGAGAGAGP